MCFGFFVDDFLEVVDYCWEGVWVGCGVEDVVCCFDGCYLVVVCVVDGVFECLGFGGDCYDFGVE